MTNYELCWVTDNGNLYADFTSKHDALKLFKYLHKKPENPIRCRIYESGEIVSENFYGAHDWEQYDSEMQDRWEYTSCCCVSKVDLISFSETTVDCFKDRESALAWIAHEITVDNEYGKSYIYVC